MCVCMRINCSLAVVIQYLAKENGYMVMVVVVVRLSASTFEICC
jgi:hypothetical protein